MKRLRVLGIATALLVAVALLGAAIGVLTIERWLPAMLHPGAFDPALTPPVPDYSKPSSWAALPEAPGDSDVALAELPASDPAATQADVFFVHSTSYVGELWNGPIDDPQVIQGTARGGTLIQASAFNACCTVYAPRYRQANGSAFLHPDADGARALEIAYKDLVAAFDHFLSAYNRGRPYFIAGHSQGSALTARLLREQVAGTPAAGRLVAAYLIGGPIAPQDLGPEFPPCARAEQTGCAVVYNARGPDYRASAIEFFNPAAARSGNPTEGWICVNPLSWQTDGLRAGRESHAGALFFDTPTPTLLPKFCDAQCQDGRLLIREMDALPEREFLSELLLWIMGPDNYHPVEYQLFYVNLRRNAQTRVKAWLRQQAASAPADEADLTATVE